MKSRRPLLLILTVAFGAVIGLIPRFSSQKKWDMVAETREGPFEVWSVYEGVIDARRVENIAPRVRGTVVIEELVPEGTRVKAGDVLVRFDTGDVERDLARLERDYRAALSEVESLENAKHPLEIRDLESRLLDAQIQADAESRYLTDLRSLLAEGLASTQEVRQQEIKVESVQKQVANLEVQLDLTRQYLHPLVLEKARAAAETLKLELDMARDRASNCVIRAPADGLVAYRTVSVGGEYRNVRVGDTLYRQTFMVIPKMEDAIVQISVPEAELSRVRVAHRAVVTPIAYPELKLRGRVESVGTMAQSIPGRPTWQKFFQVIVAIEDGDDRLRAGMSARVRVLSYASTNALTIPRAALNWDGEIPWCRVVKGRREERRELVLGGMSEREVAVLRGLSAGERVIVR